VSDNGVKAIPQSKGLWMEILEMITERIPSHNLPYTEVDGGYIMEEK
jgi:hypothetical protein